MAGYISTIILEALHPHNTEYNSIANSTMISYPIHFDEISQVTISAPSSQRSRDARVSHSGLVAEQLRWQRRRRRRQRRPRWRRGSRGLLLAEAERFLQRYEDIILRKAKSQQLSTNNIYWAGGRVTQLRKNIFSEPSIFLPLLITCS